MQKIVPHLWFDTDVIQATQTYCDLFENSKILDQSTLYDTPSGDVNTVAFQLAGMEFQALGAPDFPFNPSISLMVACETKEEVDRLYQALIPGGSELMPLDAYPFSKWYAWISDRYGLSWQIMLVDNIEEHPRIRPCLLFGLDACGKAEEAMEHYKNVFSHVQIGYVNRYQEGEAVDPRAKINYGEVTIEGLPLVVMDHGVGGDADFNEAISFIVRCEDEAELDHYWGALSADPEAEQCGWIKDAYGLSWQITPSELETMLLDGNDQQQRAVTQAVLELKKLDMKPLREAFKKASDLS